MTAYAALTARFGRISALANAIGILHWDGEAMMPKGAARERAESLALIKVLRHDMLTDPRLADEIEAAAADNSLDDWQRANLAEIRRSHASETAVPADLVAALSKAVSASEMRWRQARIDSDFKGLLPFLQEVLDRVREAGAAKGERLGLSPYEALHNDYEPGGRLAVIDPLFDDLAGFLPAFLAEAMARQAANPPPPRPAGPFAVEKQRALGLALMERLGFDFGRGRLDISTHPFCGGANNDVRITTRYDEADFAKSLMAVLHETGHALYEQGRPAAFLDQPVGRARSMSIHESQSLLVEMQVCRSRDFFTFAAPLIREAFGGSGPEWQADALWRNATRVAPGFIRVDADEVTYPLHVILRYRLEKAMIAGDLALADLPGAFNDGMKSLLGITPPDDRHGCLQDVHWPAGLFGYFPTYTLGALGAAQLFATARAAEPAIAPGIAAGDFAPLLGWLRRNVHALGSKLAVEELMTAASGRKLSVEPFKAHLARRYLPD